MAEQLPTVGGSDGSWGTDLNDFLGVGHDADGTHTKSQMLTDMGWSPTAYAGGESITFPNGLVVKVGTVGGVGEQTVTYGSSFSAGCTPIVILQEIQASGTTGSFNSKVRVSGNTQFTCWIQTDHTDAYWISIGY